MSKTKKKQEAPSKHWCFTWNDAEDRYTYEDIIDKLGSACDYLVFQQEVGEEGTKHYQGYAEFTKEQRLTSLRKLTFPVKPHWEKRRGTREQARDYAMKEETRVDGPWVSGQKPWRDAKALTKNKYREDINAVALMAKEGATDAEIFEEHPGITMQFLSHIQKARFIFKPVRTTDLKVVLLYGPPGTGKTRFFWDKFPDGWSVPVGKDLWFTGYGGQKNVLIDDFAGNIGLTQLLQILDRYPVQLPTKGHHVWWCPDNIIITSNCHPCNWYDYKERQDSYAALERRITGVFKLTKEDPNPQMTETSNFFRYGKSVGRFYLGDLEED